MELHRLKFHRDMKRGKLLRFDDLSVDERAVISKDIFSALHRGSGSRDPYEVVAEILDGWGIMCTHPAAKRTYEGKRRTDPSLYRWFECDACSCAVRNDEYVPRVGKKLGR